MRAYELVVIYRPELDEEQTNAIIDKTLGLITGNGGTIDNVDRWGKRRLAYEIKDLRDGYYVVVSFKGLPAVEHELDRVLKITEEVVRHMTVRPFEPKAKAPAKAHAE